MINGIVHSTLNVGRNVAFRRYLEGEKFLIFFRNHRLRNLIFHIWYVFFENNIFEKKKFENIF